MHLHFQRGARPLAIPAKALPTLDGSDAPTDPLTENSADTTVTVPGAPASDFAPVGAPSLRPADALPARVADTMLGIYRTKYGLDVGTVVFRNVEGKAAEVRKWCDSLAPGACAWALGTTGNGIHTFALAVGRSADGTSRCLVVDGMSPCIQRIVGELDKAFDGKTYVTPQIQRAHQLGCVVFAMRFLLMTRAPGLDEKVLASLEDFDIQYLDDMPAVRLLGLDDTWRLAGWLAATQLRNEIREPDFLLARPLDNGGRHTKWTLKQFFERHPYSFSIDLRDMYREVDVLVNDPARSLLSADRLAYLQKRFVQYAAPVPASAD